MKGSKKKIVTGTLVVCVAMAGLPLSSIKGQTYQDLKRAAVSKTITVTAGTKQKIKVKKVPVRTNRSFQCSDSSVATVNKKGMLTARKAGTAIIKIKLRYKDKKKTVRCKVVVVNATTSQMPANTPDRNYTTSAPANGMEATTTKKPSNPANTTASKATQKPGTTPGVTATPKATQKPAVTEKPGNQNKTPATASAAFTYTSSMQDPSVLAVYDDGTKKSYTIPIADIKEYAYGTQNKISYTVTQYAADGSVAEKNSYTATDAFLDYTNMVLTVPMEDVTVKFVVKSVSGRSGSMDAVATNNHILSLQFQ